MDNNLKNVTFHLEKNQTKIIYVYSYALRNSRSGLCWIQKSLDNARFQKRIKETEIILSHVLNNSHRLWIYNKRFKNL